MPAGRWSILFALTPLSLASSDTCSENAASFLQLAPPALHAAGQPRFCILDQPPPADEFIARFEDAVSRHAIYEFIAVERNPQGDALDGLDEFNPSYMPTYPQMQKADVACQGMTDGPNSCFVSARKVAWSKVRTMWFSDCPGSKEHCFGECSNLSTSLEDPEAQASLDGTFRARLIHGPCDKLLLSHYDLAAALGRGWFRYMFFQANDRLDLLSWPQSSSSPTEQTKIETSPMALSMQYLRGRERLLLDAAKTADLSAKRGILGAWDVRKKSPLFPALVDRTDIDTWANSTGSFVERRSIDPLEYFAELSKYRFLVSPEGSGIQSSKFLEALVVQTIPITKRFKCFQDLRDYGYPMVVVDSWDEITPESLDLWWAQLSPKLEDARWLSTVEGQESLLYGTCYDNM